MKNPIDFIAYPCDAGTAQSGCAAGPSTLRARQLEIGLDRRASWHMPLTPPPSHWLSHQVIAHYCRYLRHHMFESLSQGHFPITLGGDHSMAMGSWRGALDFYHPQPFGLLWIDAHMDAHSPSSSHSGNIHGMPLATLLGRGSPISITCGGLNPKRLALIGVRSFEPEEQAYLDQMGVRYWTMHDIRKQGWKHVLEKALRIVTQHSAHFGVTLDIDGLDPAIAPATGIHVPGGISRDTILGICHALSSQPKLAAFEVAEYHPDKDQHYRTFELIKQCCHLILND